VSCQRQIIFSARSRFGSIDLLPAWLSKPVPVPAPATGAGAGAGAGAAALTGFAAGQGVASAAVLQSPVVSSAVEVSSTGTAYVAGSGPATVDGSSPAAVEPFDATRLSGSDGLSPSLTLTSVNISGVGIIPGTGAGTGEGTELGSLNGPMSTTSCNLNVDFRRWTEQ